MHACGYALKAGSAPPVAAVVSGAIQQGSCARPASAARGCAAQGFDDQISCPHHMARILCP